MQLGQIALTFKEDSISLKPLTFNYGVAVKEHCFACTAGSGSSCGGTLT